MKSGLPFMMDPREKEFLSDDTNMCFKRCCINCGTSKTPLWRGGPAGPKSLCNACGIRYRKKKMSIMGSTKSTEKKRETLQTHGSTAISAMTTTLTTNTSSDTTDISTAKPDNIGSDSDIKDPVKVQFVAFGNEMMLQRSTPVVKKQRCQRKKKLGEEEQAAFLLMALSCGSVFA